MKIERLSTDKIRIFLTYDDLSERGIKKDDLWREIPKVHELFSEMMEQAYSELGFEVSGPLAVEVFQLPAQGMVVIVTRGKSEALRPQRELEEDEDDVFEMEVTLEHSEVISYLFHDFEDLLRMAKVVAPLTDDGGTLFSYKGKWILQLEPRDSDSEEEDDRDHAVIAVMSEYGEATSVTRAVLEEYGKVVIADDAVHELCRHFA